MNIIDSNQIPNTLKVFNREAYLNANNTDTDSC